MTNQQGAPEALRFTKKPVTIEAIQWTGKNLREVITFTDGRRAPDTRSTHAGMAWEAYADLVERDGLKIYTLEGTMLANPGDWIIRGVKGEMYPCKDEIFRLTYEPASLVEAQQPAPSAARHLDHPSTEGMVITDAMIEAGKKMLHNSYGHGARATVTRIFSAMIAASPTSSADSVKDQS